MAFHVGLNSFCIIYRFLFLWLHCYRHGYHIFYIAKVVAYKFVAWLVGILSTISSEWTLLLSKSVPGTWFYRLFKVVQTNMWSLLPYIKSNLAALMVSMIFLSYFDPLTLHFFLHCVLSFCRHKNYYYSFVSPSVANFILSKFFTNWSTLSKSRR